MKKLAAENVRAVSAEIINAVISSGQSLDTALASNEERILVNDRPLLRMLCYGYLRYRWQIEYWIDQLVSKPLRKRDRIINFLLGIGLYQLYKLNIPNYVVVSETVEAAKKLKRKELVGLVNACLRRFERENISKLEIKDEQSKWNHPSWVIELIKKDWPHNWQEILEANNKRAPMWLRVNVSKCTVDQYIERLSLVNIEAYKMDGFDNAVCLKKPQAVSELPGFDSGEVSVQDAGAQIAAHWLLKDTKNSVLDACAAPGGKSSHILEIAGNDLSLVSIDINQSRILSIRENFRRIGKTATILEADASKPEDWWDGVKFEAILLDAPCSSSGVIRRHPDIKTLRRLSDLKNLSNLQLTLLNKLWDLLLPGGTLLYATCSIFSKENDEVISVFLSNHDDALENKLLPNNNIRDLMIKKEYGFQILPGLLDLDGFYYAALKKIEK
tara:strand:- start:38690 stop:40018 length:1329 start_codon:yes stop_codon:yes gene_type:complete